ncbi:MAG: hypothetical protein M3325_11845 [Actinomycetota bacterium]|jgi:hypothetical protein|nr:hypothetical protein [Actinomycetota bacterium]MDQ3904297.1 hypothetical protein [Actinomycetota bacterium]
MTYLVPASGRNGNNDPHRWNPTGNADISSDDLGVHSGASDPTRMVGGVLLLVAATIVFVLMMVGF